MVKKYPDETLGERDGLLEDHEGQNGYGGTSQAPLPPGKSTFAGRTQDLPNPAIITKEALFKLLKCHFVVKNAENGDNLSAVLAMIQAGQIRIPGNAAFVFVGEKNKQWENTRGSLYYYAKQGFANGKLQDDVFQRISIKTGLEEPVHYIKHAFPIADKDDNTNDLLELNAHFKESDAPFELNVATIQYLQTALQFNHFEHVLPPKKTETYWTPLFLTLLAFCFLPWLVEPLFTSFMYMGLSLFFNDNIDRYIANGDLPLSFGAPLKTACMLLSLGMCAVDSFINGFVINPTSFAHGLAHKESKTNSTSDDDNPYWVSAKTVTTIKTIASIGIFLPAIAAYLCLAMANVVGLLSKDSPVEELDEHFISNLGFQIPTTIVIGLACFIFYMAFMTDALIEHMQVYIDRLFRKDFSVLKSMTQNPAKTFYVGLRVGANNIYFLGSAMMISDFMLSIYGLPRNHSAFRPLVITAGLLAFFTTACSRLLPLARGIFLEPNEQLDKRDLVSFSLTRSQIIMNVLNAGIPSFCLGYFTTAILKNEAHFYSILSLGAGAGLGTILFAISFHVLQRMELLNNAFARSSYLQQKAQGNQAAIEKVDISNPLAVSRALFDEIAKDRFDKNPVIPTLAPLINTTASLTRVLAFVGFALKLAADFSNVPFVARRTPEEIMAIALFFASLFLGADRKVYEGYIRWAFELYLTTWDREVLQTHKKGLWSAFFTPKERLDTTQLAPIAGRALERKEGLGDPSRPVELNESGLETFPAYDAKLSPHGP